MFNNKKVLIAALVFFGQFFAFESYGDDLLAKFHPYISIQEEYTDNLYLTPVNKKEDWATTISPGLSFSNMDRQGGVDLNYTLGIVEYAKYSEKNYVSHNGGLNAKYLTRAHWNFYLKDTYVRSDEPNEPSQLEAIFLPSVQTERFVYWRNVLSPSVEYQYSSENKVGFAYRSNIYDNEDPARGRSRENYFNPSWTHWFDKRNGIVIQYGYTNGDFDTKSDLKGHMGSLRYNYRLSTQSNFFAEYMYLTRTFDDSGLDYKVHDPKIGFTYALNPTLTFSGQAGYYRKEPEVGDKVDGPTYQFQLSQIEQKTTYSILLQGGYSEDYFSSENLGFVRYNRLVVSLKHLVNKKLSAGLSGNVGRSDDDTGRRDTSWGVAASGSYAIYKWLNVSLDLSRQERRSSLDLNDYTEYKGVARISATY